MPAPENNLKLKNIFSLIAVNTPSLPLLLLLALTVFGEDFRKKRNFLFI
jgi:hypothetical protein